MGRTARNREFINPLIQQSNNPAFGVVPEVGIAPTSPPLQEGANLPQLLGKAENGLNGLVDSWIKGERPPAGCSQSIHPIIHLSSAWVGRPGR